MRGLSNSSCLLFERKTNHVSTSNQITRGFSRGQINLLWPPSLLHKSRSDLRRFGGRLQREMSQAFKQQKRTYDIWVVLSMILLFSPLYTWGKDPIWLYNIFRWGWLKPPTRHGLWKTSNTSWVTIYILLSAPQKTYRNPNTLHLRLDSTRESLQLSKTPAIDWLGFLSKGMKNYSVILGIIMSHYKIYKNPYYQTCISWFMSRVVGFWSLLKRASGASLPHYLQGLMTMPGGFLAGFLNHQQ